MSASFSSTEIMPGPIAEEPAAETEGPDRLLPPTQELASLSTEEDAFYSIVFNIKRLLLVRESSLSSSSSHIVTSSSSNSSSGAVTSYLNLALNAGRAFTHQKIGLGAGETSCTSATKEDDYIPDITSMSIKRSLSSIRILARRFLATSGNKDLDTSMRRLLREDGSERNDPSAEDVQSFFTLCFEDPVLVRTHYI